ncbi:arsenate-mycothiol transferase ArsC [Halorarum salinum]|uniref:Low molecular weight phosphatase family protein n=1 Tax=Halorarum salinum TaxID=2743089 RepID=A0A7D5L9I5_9EURY|nr:low molecular weight phosphatase family protein [Halobaculum salinum]QLG61248.1 low molecular weight phosphatase family protein [Halobaculum salinum]
MTRVAFVCVGNAGRSQMATAFAERERDERGLDVDVVTGGTDPAERVHDSVVEVMGEEGIDVSDRKPRQITPEDVEDVDYVVTMGCSVDQFRPEGWTGESERWDLEHPGGDGLDAVRRQRDEIARRVSDFFDDLEADGGRSSER